MEGLRCLCLNRTDYSGLVALALTLLSVFTLAGLVLSSLSGWALSPAPDAAAGPA